MAQVILQPRIMDYGLVSLDTDCDRVCVCSQEPTTFVEAVQTFTLGFKSTVAGGVFAAPQASPGGGRTVTSVPVINGTITIGGTATHIAFVDSVTLRLLVVAPLSAPVSVFTNETWSLDAITVHLFN